MNITKIIVAKNIMKKTNQILKQMKKKIIKIKIKKIKKFFKKRETTKMEILTTEYETNKIMAILSEKNTIEGESENYKNLLRQYKLYNDGGNEIVLEDNGNQYKETTQTTGNTVENENKIIESKIIKIENTFIIKNKQNKQINILTNNKEGNKNEGNYDEKHIDNVLKKNTGK